MSNPEIEAIKARVDAGLAAHEPEKDLRALLAEVRRLTADRAITHEQAVQACANVGVDLTCGACAAVFYTGVGSPHDVHTCAGRDESDALRRSAEAAIRETGALRDGVTEAIGLAWRPIPQPFGATAYACPDDRDIIEAARTVVKERDEARAQVERLTDLVRHQRGALHTEGLLTDAEYADLAGLTGSPARLEGYDALLGELERTKRALNVAIGERGALQAIRAYLDAVVTQPGRDDFPADALAAREARGFERGKAEGAIAAARAIPMRWMTWKEPR